MDFILFISNVPVAVWIILGFVVGALIMLKLPTKKKTKKGDRHEF